jgi:chaperonin cofactor prefoldin
MVKVMITEKTKNLKKLIDAEVQKCVSQNMPCANDLKSIQTAINDLEKNEEQFIKTTGNEVARLNILGQITSSLDVIDSRFQTYTSLSKDRPLQNLPPTPPLTGSTLPSPPPVTGSGN